MLLLPPAQAQVAPGGGAAADVTAWPEFHNGVAAGALSPEQEPLGGDAYSTCWQN